MALLEFFGKECPHCLTMDPLVDKLEQEMKVQVQKFEVWHDKKNAQTMQKYDRGFCGGVPFFFNDQTSKWICGETSYEELKKWAQ